VVSHVFGVLIQAFWLWLSGSFCSCILSVFVIVQSLFYFLKITWNLFSCEWLYINYWKSVVTLSFDMLNSMNKSSWFCWVELLHNTFCLFLIMQPWLYTCYKFTCTLLMRVLLYKLLKKSCLPPFLCAESNYQSILVCFEWKFFLIRDSACIFHSANHDFYSCKNVTWKLFSC